MTQPTDSTLSKGQRAADAADARPARRDTLALLGYPPNARLLIVNADDLGMCHAVTAATFAGLEDGLLTSASLMMPCPWAYATCAHLRAHPQLDVGVHLTFTSEWDTYRWGPLLGPGACPSLCDAEGHFYKSAAEVWAHGDPAEAQVEAEAQLRRALDWGVEPTHLDGHMDTVYADPRYLDLYIKLARRYQLPLRMAARRLYAERGASALYDALPLDGLLRNDDLRFVALEDPPALEEQLVETIRTLEPGVTELCVHVASATPEAQAVMGDWAARVEALRLMTSSSAVRDALSGSGITRIGWRELRESQRRQGAHNDSGLHG